MCEFEISKTILDFFQSTNKPNRPDFPITSEQIQNVGAMTRPFLIHRFIRIITLNEFVSLFAID